MSWLETVRSTVHAWELDSTEHFTVAYRINPWMNPQDPTDTAVALGQWQRLHDTYVALGHDVELPTIIDESLQRFDVLWAAAGTPHDVFAIRTAELIQALPGAQVADVS